MLMMNGLPIVNVSIMMRNSNIADITLATNRKQQRKGYGTQAIKMIEQMLFKNPNILFITLKDFTKERIASKIALKSGYNYDEKTNLFIKANPNINLEDLMNLKR